MPALTGAGDLVARFGGDELCLLLAGNASQAEAVLASEVTASFGVAARRDGDTLAAMLLRADRALYRAKQHGRDQAMLEAA